MNEPCLCLYFVHERLSCSKFLKDVIYKFILQVVSYLQKSWFTINQWLFLGIIYKVIAITNRNLLVTYLNTQVTSLNLHVMSHDLQVRHRNLQEMLKTHNAIWITVDIMRFTIDP